MLDRVLNISSEAEFEEVAALVLARQKRDVFGEYLRRAGLSSGFLPIEFFKTHRVYCGASEPELAFRSSGTGGERSVHHIARLKDYERTFRAGFERAYGKANIYALLPGYRPESSLIYMVRGLGGRFFSHAEALYEALAADEGRKILFGVSHALLDLTGHVPTGTIVMETGGMKGRREELSKQELHRQLCAALGVKEIHSEYGMAELSSQAWSLGGGRFVCPPWMRVVARDVNDPFRPLPAGQRGGLNITDLANLHSCAFIQTQDVGTVNADGTFTVEGRISRSEIRGCNLLMEN